MAIFNSYVKLPEGSSTPIFDGERRKPWFPAEFTNNPMKLCQSLASKTAQNWRHRNVQEDAEKVHFLVYDSWNLLLYVFFGLAIRKHMPIIIHPIFFPLTFQYWWWLSLFFHGTHGFPTASHPHHEDPSGIRDNVDFLDSKLTRMDGVNKMGQ